jgi:hypothetical protein
MQRTKGNFKVIGFYSFKHLLSKTSLKISLSSVFSFPFALINQNPSFLPTMTSQILIRNKIAFGVWNYGGCLNDGNRLLARRGECLIKYIHEHVKGL